MYIYGKNVVKETINSGRKITRAYVFKKSHEQGLIQELKSKKIQIRFVDEIALNRMVDGNHQGFVLEIDEVESYSLEDFLSSSFEHGRYPLVVLLDHLEDPHNFGAIIRTCEAMGVDGIIIPNDRSVGINGTVVKTSAGAISYVRIIRVANLGAAISKLKNCGYWVVGTDMDGENYISLHYDMPVCLVIGNEGHGMSKTVRNSCDYVAKIPMYGKINSLNASVSCGIFLSEIVRQRMK